MKVNNVNVVLCCVVLSGRVVWFGGFKWCGFVLLVWFGCVLWFGAVGLVVWSISRTETFGVIIQLRKAM